MLPMLPACTLFGEVIVIVVVIVVMGWKQSKLLVFWPKTYLELDSCPFCQTFTMENHVCKIIMLSFYSKFHISLPLLINSFSQMRYGREKRKKRKGGERRNTLIWMARHILCPEEWKSMWYFIIAIKKQFVK